MQFISVKAMALKVFFVIVAVWQTGHSRSVSPKISDADAYFAPLTPKQVETLETWTEDSKQNIWELSGQFQGDMVLTPEQKNGLVDGDYKWKNLEIPYQIDPVFNSEQRAWIERSLSEYYNKTCIKPRPRSSSDEDYVYVTGATTGCHSAVGRRGGRQTLNLQLNEPGSGCLRLGTIVHEFLHALGFYHMQSTWNRDEYVEIVWDNISKGKEHNFNIYSENVVSNFGEKYDYGSVLHYSEYAFSKNDEKTIVPLNSDAKIGQRLGMSDIDARKLNKMYGCPV